MYINNAGQYINNAGHKIKMTIMVKTIQKSSSLELVDQFQQTWHVAPGTRVLQCGH